MHSSPSAAWLSEMVAPLTDKFGAELTLNRTGNMVCWGYDGQCAVIELTSGEAMSATFIDAVQKDAISANPMAAAYRTRSTYGLNGPGCKRMVTDLVDFFSGVREPKFTFVDVFPR